VRLERLAGYRISQLARNELFLMPQLGGTMIAHYTHGNVLMVQKLLGHKRIQNTMKYIHMITFKDDEFEVATATTVEEAKSVLTVGFDYVAEKDGIMLFRRPKRFNA